MFTTAFKQKFNLLNIIILNMEPTFYETVRSITKSMPNNMDLGNAIRSLINKIEDAKQVEPEVSTDSNQITIFQDLENYGNRS